jgi:hypothetical protein
VALRNGWMSGDAFWARHGTNGARPQARVEEVRTELLLEAEYYAQWMYTSCGFFFEDLDRIEPRNDIAFGRRAISLVWQATHENLQPGFLSDLAAAKSWRTGLTGVELYRQLPPVARDLLPREATQPVGDEPAA